MKQSHGGQERRTGSRSAARGKRVPKESILVSVLLVLALSGYAKSSPATIALVGGTIIDLANGGNASNDVRESVILIEGQQIVAVGRPGEIEIPSAASVIDVGGRYIVPGLIEGFGTLNNQAYADAYLYSGVTSVIPIYGGRRGPSATGLDPSPNILLWGFVGHTATPNAEELLAQLAELKAGGIRVVHLGYKLTPELIDVAVEYAEKNGIGTIGELGYTSYRAAIESGIDAIVHTGRYVSDVAPEQLRQETAEAPFGPAKQAFNRWMIDLDLADSAFVAYARFLGATGVGLIPTLSLFASVLPNHRNPWLEPAASIIDPADIHNPVDVSTGRHAWPAPQESYVRQLAEKIMEISRAIHEAGGKYLAGSAADVNGTMPGISLHREIELLTLIGLTNRQAIAAATSNFAEVFGWKEVGLVAPGRRADLLVVTGDPLENVEHLKNIEILLLRGQIVDRERLLRQ